MTERCVFRLKQKGLELIEVAPGIDIEQHILANMEFKPIINKDKIQVNDDSNSPGWKTSCFLSFPTPEKLKSETNFKLSTFQIHIQNYKISIRYLEEMTLSFPQDNVLKFCNSRCELSAFSLQKLITCDHILWVLFPNYF